MMGFKILLCVVFVSLAECSLYPNIIGTPIGGVVNPFVSNTLDLFRGVNIEAKRRCPICDPSVYSYCTDKLFHDSCCCHNPNNPYDQLPYQCAYADCSFLHANSCQEHKLITACCCISPNVYYKK